MRFSPAPCCLNLPPPSSSFSSSSALARWTLIARNNDVPIVLTLTYPVPGSRLSRGTRPSSSNVEHSWVGLGDAPRRRMHRFFPLPPAPRSACKLQLRANASPCTAGLLANILFPSRPDSAHFAGQKGEDAGNVPPKILTTAEADIKDVSSERGSFCCIPLSFSSAHVCVCMYEQPTSPKRRYIAAKRTGLL